MSASLVTSRLALGAFRPDDLDALVGMDGDERVMRNLGNGLPARTRDECVTALARMRAYAEANPGYGSLRASRRDDGTFVGACGLFPLEDTGDIEIAYRLPVARWGHGYATEMAAAVLGHAFGTLRLPRVVGVTHLDNVASQRVLLKIGMREEGVAEHFGRPMRCFAIARGDAA